MSIVVENDARGGVTVWLDRPAKRNALDEATLVALRNASQELRETQSARLALLRSTSSVFCAGADLNDWANPSPSEAVRLSMLGNDAFRALSEVPIPTVAVIEGAALGGGLELALACDIRVGTDACRVGFPEPRLGNTPAWGGIPRLIEICGIATARNMLLTGEMLDSAEAHRVGILQRLWPSSNFDSQLARLVEAILACDGATLAFLKSMLRSEGVDKVCDAALAGFNATRTESQDRKATFLAQRREF